jgi:hypothetical protein
VKTNWIQDEILQGLQKLLSLSLDRTPAAELLPITVGTWVEAINRGREFDQELDTQRFRDAFVTLADSRRAWPLPKDFIDDLPERSQLRLAKTTIPADPERAAQAIQDARKALGLKS